MQATRQHLLCIFEAALQAVNGKSVVEDAFKTDMHNFQEFHVVAIGKAADAMLQGVPGQNIKSGLIISKHGHISKILQQDSRLVCIESDHPIPGKASIKAGQALLDYLSQLPQKAPCLFLISGGTSALVEVLQEGYKLTDLQEMNHYLLANDYSIDEINNKRRQLSRIKGGGLWDYLGNRDVYCLMISDVADDDPAIIGSGLLFPVPENRNLVWTIIASLNDAKQAATKKARELGYKVVVVSEFLNGNAEYVAKECVATLNNNPGTLFIWGGETTVTLPETPGKGGRNQHLALAAAIEMDGLNDCVLLAAGTDGSDGNTFATGAIVDALSVRKAKLKSWQATDYLQKADSNTFFSQTGELLITGATGTNVMDLIIAINK